MRDLCVFDLDGTLIPYDSFGRLVRRNLAAHPQLACRGHCAQDQPVIPRRICAHGASPPDLQL